MRISCRSSALLVFGMLAGLAAAFAPQRAHADDAAQSSPYRLVMTLATDGTTWQTFRLNTQTGQVCWPDFVNNAWVWQKGVESAALPAGDYDIQVRSYGSGDNVADAVFRIERKTGRSWKLDNGAWLTIAEPQ